MPQQIGWSVEAKLLYEIKQLTRQLSGRQYILTFPTFASFPTPGITGTLYVDESTGDIYVWNGTAYTILSSGITALNGLIAAAQLLTTGSTGTDFNISSVGTTHTFNIPTASATNRGLLSSANWTTFNNKQNAITLTTTGTSGAATLVGSTLNIPQYQSVLTNPVTGTGTTNYIPKFTAASTIGNSQIFDDGSSILIKGTNNPLSDPNRGNITLNGTLSNILAFTNGSSATGYLFQSTADMQLYNATATGNLRLFTNATERLRITSGGDVGIGTDAPNARITVQAGASVASAMTFRANNVTSTSELFVGQSIGNDAFFYNRANAIISLGTNNAERMRIFANGRVGINTTTDAGYQLDVNGTLRTANGANFATSSGNVGVNTINPLIPLQLNSYGGFDGNGNQLIIRNNLYYNTTNARSEPIVTGFQTMIEMNNNNGSLIFSTSPSSNTVGTAASITEAMRINSSGNVGIGINPLYRLDVLAPSGTARVFRFSGNAANDNTSIIISGKQTNAELWAYGNEVATGGTGRNFDIYDLVANVNRLRINSSGNIGIGTLSPTERLEVNGNIKTASPSGGTAKPWKLGNVAAVTPTSPNRTIEVEIDGVTYYLHAKTTNN